MRPLRGGRLSGSFIILVTMVTMSTLLVAGTTGKIAGKIKDAQSGEAMIGANVRVEGTSLGATTDVDGNYVILNIPPGKYTVTASYVGYDKKTVTGVEIAVDMTTTLNFELTSAVVQEKEVVIIAQAPVIRRDRTSSEARVDASQIGTIPTREVNEVLSLQAGITVDRSGGIHIRGGRSNEVGYWVNGVSVSDGFDGSQSVQVDNSAIQELQVVSGTFNAEYGQAMSGIVNIVTKDGGQQLHGGVSSYGGSYYTPDAVFYNLNKVRPLGTRDLEVNLNGPIVPGVSFYVSGRYLKSDGWLFGNKTFNPDGSLAPGADTLKDASGNFVTINKPNNPVPMNDRERLSGQGKLTFQVAPTIKLSFSGVGSKINYRDYNHAFKLNPDGDVRKYDNGYDLSGQWTHTLGSSAFYTVNFSYFNKEFKEYLYADPLDSRYIVDPTKTNTNLYEFLRAGTNNHHFTRNTQTSVIKTDYTDQVNRLHEMKAGLEAKFHKLYLQDFNVTPVQDSSGALSASYKPSIPSVGSPFYQEYEQSPVEFSGYIQDKMEYQSMIVNIGVRYDYFDSKGNILADAQDPNVYLPQKAENQNLPFDQRVAKWYKKVQAKHYVSPRFGISYPITDRGVLHFSYGHFLQIPPFSYLYQSAGQISQTRRNDAASQPVYGYKVDAVNPLQGLFGNPDLNPQKTVQYEFGLQQQIAEDISVDITGFYRDTRDWVSTGPAIPVRDPTGQTSTVSYTTYVNKDYANSRGVTVVFNKRPSSDLLTVNLSYTYQIAEGLNSSAEEEQGALVSNQEPTKSLTPLNYDQTHTLNLTMGVGRADWGLYLIGRYNTGVPYSPVINQAESRGEDAARVSQKYSRRQPDIMTLDMRIFKDLDLEIAKVSLSLKVFNLLDRRNETSVWGQTGRAYATPAQLGVSGVGGLNRINTIEEYINRPDFFSEPRQIQFGVDLNF